MAHPANNIIGIDLGTTTTLVARFNENGTPEILPNRAGQDMTPSVVQILDNGDVIIGDEAKKFVGSDTPNVFAEFKREIGSDKKWVVNGRIITPTDLTALLLNQVVEECSGQFGKPTAVAISWPANFREEQRQATMDAAKKAGLDTTHFISDSCAAALYYSTDTRLSGHYFIYDFGSGTFGATIIKADGNDIDVVWTEGVQQLGGKDLDTELLKIIGSNFKAKTGCEFNPFDCNFGKREVEEAKHALSVRDKISIRVVSNAHGPVAMEITREEFEAAISHLVTQAEIACETALMNGKVAKSDIREVFMTGGTSRLPVVQRSVERLFGKKPIVKNPDRATALGTAVYAALKHNSAVEVAPMQREFRRHAGVRDVAPCYLGLIASDSEGNRAVEIMVSKGAPLPCVTTKVFRPMHGSKDKVEISVTQFAYEERNPEFVSVVYQTELRIDNPTRGIRLMLGYDANGCIIMGIDPRDDDGDPGVTANLPAGPSTPLFAAKRLSQY